MQEGFWITDSILVYLSKQNSVLVLAGLKKIQERFRKFESQDNRVLVVSQLQINANLRDEWL